MGIDVDSKVRFGMKLQADGAEAGDGRRWGAAVVGKVEMEERKKERRRRAGARSLFEWRALAVVILGCA